MNPDMKIQYAKNDPYAEVLNNFIFQQYPVPTVRTPEAVLDAVTSELIGTGQYRFGPKPNPESLVAIRAVVRRDVDAGRPIPVLVPFGGMKTNPRESVDVAELSALKILECLNDRVGVYYAPGLDVQIRIEDTGAHWLFREQNNGLWIDRYSEDFAKLTRIVQGVPNGISAIKESALMDKAEYFEQSAVGAAVIFDYVMAHETAGYPSQAKAAAALEEIGWKGDVPESQREYYRSRYRSLYPGKTETIYTHMLADYLGGAWARHKLNGRGNRPSWDMGWLNLSFVPPVPGAPADLVSTYLFYRVIPQKYTRDSIAPWRGKGYLRVSNNVATPAIASWNAETFYNPFQVVFSNDNEEVFVGADYVVYD